MPKASGLMSKVSLGGISGWSCRRSVFSCNSSSGFSTKVGLVILPEVEVDFNPVLQVLAGIPEGWKLISSRAVGLLEHDRLKHPTIQTRLEPMPGTHTHWPLCIILLSFPCNDLDWLPVACGGRCCCNSLTSLSRGHDHSLLELARSPPSDNLSQARCAK